jgi:kynureninase
MHEEPSPPLSATSLYRTPNALAPCYRRFRVSERLLLTGHSHQAWPDCGLEGQRRAWVDAAELVDEKWSRALEVADRVRRGYARLLDDGDGDIALGANTHELVVRFLSALPLRGRPRLVTTDGEFHSIRRQLDRLSEEGLEVVKVPAHPASAIAERLTASLDARTAAVLVSSVLFETAEIVPGLDEVSAACARVGTELLVDAYHHLNVVPLSLGEQGLGNAFVVGGGYKYMQLGEGNCFLRSPPGCQLRPAITGWYSEFGALAEGRASGRVVYGEGPYRFAGATYDPTSHYRAAAVLDFFERLALTPALLREVSQHQVGLLGAAFDALDLHPAVVRREHAVPLHALGGFLALRSPRAAALSRALRTRGVHTDSRGDVLRLGPAPYLTDAQLTTAMAAMAEAVAALTER